MKKLLSILVIMALVVSFFPCYYVYAGNTTLDVLKQEYPDGSQWNESYYFATQCAGFARLMFDKYYGYNPVDYCEVSYDLNSLKAGDVLRYDGGGAYSGGHEVWVLAVNGNNITVGECNWSGNNIVSWGRVMYKSDITNVQHIYVAPYALDTSEPALKSASNVKANVNDSSYGVDVTWDKINSASGYLIEVYTADDVESGDFNSPVKSIEVKRPTTTSSKITKLPAGNYYVFVKEKRGSKVSTSRGNGAKFYINPITSISLDKTSLGMVVGGKSKLTATINPSDTTDNKTVKWSSSNTNVATVDQEGNITALAEGYATITVSASNSVEEKCSVIVSYTENPIRGINITPSKVTLEEGKTVTLSVSFVPEKPTGDTTIEWSSYNEKVATVDKYGKVTAVGVGETYIAAKAVNGTLSTIRITVTEAKKYPITNVKLNENKKTIKTGEKFKLIATISPSYTTDDKTIEWSSSNNNVATVDENGIVKAIKIGTTTITAKAGTRTATCEITVECSHILEKVNAVAATCTKKGNIEYYECLECHKKFSDNTASNELTNIETDIDENAHDWNEWVIVKPVSENEVGIKERTCKNNVSHKERANIYRKGDINGDGKVNVKDLEILYGYINETLSLNSEELQRAELNDDGKVNARDLNRLYEHITEVNPLD